MLKQSFPKSFAIRFALLDLAVQIVDSNDGECHGQALACHLFKDVRYELFHKLAAVPAFKRSSLARRVALGILHWARHSRHSGAEALLASSVSLGLRIRSRSLEVTASLLVVLGPAFCSEPSTLGNG